MSWKEWLLRGKNHVNILNRISGEARKIFKDVKLNCNFYGNKYAISSF